MKYTIREAQKNDMPQVLELIKELAAYENASNQVEIEVADLEKEGFENGNFNCFVAEVDGKIQGMALVYFKNTMNRINARALFKKISGSFF